MDLPAHPTQRKAITVPCVIDLTAAGNADQLSRQGFSKPEPSGCWTDGPEVHLLFSLDPAQRKDVLLTMEVGAFLVPDKIPRQQVDVRLNDTLVAAWTISDNGWFDRTMILPLAARGRGDIVSIHLSIPTCRVPAAIGVGPDTRNLGISLRRLIFSPIPAASPYSRVEPAVDPQLGRAVGTESRRTYDEKIRSGFWARYITGPRVLDIGSKGNDVSGKPLEAGAALPIIEGAIGIDLDYPGYDGRTLPFPSESQDAVYSSNSLEHIPDYIKAIQEWHRVLKVGGHIIVAVPHAHLYERRRRPPSTWNLGHLRMYTAASLLAEFEAALRPNSYRVRHLYEDDRGYRYEDPPDRHGIGGYEIELVVEKIKEPGWAVAD